VGKENALGFEMLNAGNSAESELWTETWHSVGRTTARMSHSIVSFYCLLYVIASKEVISLNEANFILRYMRIIISDLLYLREN